MAIKLHREFPVVGGEIVDRKGKAIVTSLGADRLRVQRRVLVVRENPILHPVTGQSLGLDYELLGRARLVQVQQDFSKGEVYPESANEIDPANRVITQ